MAVGTGFGTRSLADFRKSFFDADRILKGMDRATHRNLSRFGAHVRQRSRTSIRYRKDPAPPGKPPSAHKTGQKTTTNKRTGVTKRQASSPLRDLVLFAYDKAARRVVIGPVIFPSARRKGTPERLEYGGTSAGSRRVPGTRQRVAAVFSYEARPFMHPAAAAEMPKLLESFRGSLR
jgi:hypothetical protein